MNTDENSFAFLRDRVSFGKELIARIAFRIG
jgi:hypothetical protein